MFIIVESGSTKADWVMVDEDGRQGLHVTEGINPSTQATFPVLNNDDLLGALSVCRDIFFYGAGADDISSPDRLKSWLQAYGFAGRIEVKSDLLAAARACSKNKPAIVCILGTGSNSCVYDGSEMIESIPSLGYIFSDEGGGVHLGKEIIKDYFYGNMPEVVKWKFEKEYAISKHELINEVYRNHAGSRYIASFSSFLMDDDINREESWKTSLLKKVFREFVQTRLIKYTQHLDLPIVFVGSIAFYYQKYLVEVLAEFGMQIAKVVQQPIHDLVNYHKSVYS